MLKKSVKVKYYNINLIYMQIQKWVILITIILIINTYYDGKIFEF